MCDEKEQLVGYLYDDLTDADRAAFEAHLRGCADCRGELKALRGVRADLSQWAPPEPDFGFRVVRGGRDAAATDMRAIAPPVQSWRAWWTPAAGLAAAAVLVLAAAASLAHIEVHRGPDGITVRTGWSAFAPAATSAASGSYGETGASRPSQDVRLTPASDANFVAEIERRLAALEAASRDSGVRNASSLSARSSSDTEIIRRVRDMLAQSEQKQQGELALRIADVIRDVEAQRLADLGRIRKGLSNIEDTVTAEAAAHRELTTFVLASAKQK
jgi:Putative zinc-finger